MTKPEICLEINDEIGDKIMAIDQQYLDGLITKEEFAVAIGHYITAYVFEYDAILVKIMQHRKEV